MQAICIQENDYDQKTLQELLDMMKEHNPDNATYTLKHLKSRRLDHFGEDIITTNMPKLKKRCYFSPQKILDFYKFQKYDDPEEEKMNIIRTASQLIKSDIKEIPVNKDTYHVPKNHQSLVRNLFLSH